MLAEDIIQKVQSDFPFMEDQKLVVELLERFFHHNSIPEKDRMIRCVLFLAEGDVENVEYYLKGCEVDYRDVIMEAEYDWEDKRVRDFNKPFDN